MNTTVISPSSPVSSSFMEKRHLETPQTPWAVREQVEFFGIVSSIRPEPSPGVFNPPCFMENDGADEAKDEEQNQQIRTEFQKDHDEYDEKYDPSNKLKGFILVSPSAIPKSRFTRELRPRGTFLQPRRTASSSTSKYNDLTILDTKAMMMMPNTPVAKDHPNVVTPLKDEESTNGEKAKEIDRVQSGRDEKTPTLCMDLGDDIPMSRGCFNLPTTRLFAKPDSTSMFLDGVGSDSIDERSNTGWYEHHRQDRSFQPMMFD